jgi:hypothetical protein
MRHLNEPFAAFSSVFSVSRLRIGYCWRPQKCGNLWIPYAFLEGKKAGETPARKSTPITWKEIRQQ